MNSTQETVEEGGAKPVPRFWVYAGQMNLVCQWCDTDIFRSPEDVSLADLADFQKAAETHVCQQTLTVIDVRALAAQAHEGQTDKLGVPYIEHARAVAAGVAPFGEDLLMAGLLHDVIEDTDWTAEALIAAGVPEQVVSIVQAVTNVPGGSYQEKIKKIAGNRQATLVKIADNAHNSRPDRLAALDEKIRARLEKKYSEARKILWGAVRPEEIESILTTVNPDLLGELRKSDFGCQCTGYDGCPDPCACGTPNGCLRRA